MDTGAFHQQVLEKVTQTSTEVQGIHRRLDVLEKKLDELPDRYTSKRDFENHIIENKIAMEDLQRVKKSLWGIPIGIILIILTQVVTNLWKS